MDDLTDDERQTVIDLIDEAIRESHFPLSPRGERLRAIRDKLRNAVNAQHEAKPSSQVPKRRGRARAR